MEQTLDFLTPPLLDNGLRSEQETMEHYRQPILLAEDAAEYVRATKLMDIFAQEESNEVDLKDALGLRRRLLL
jgi:bacterioferritin (cytochrome b1)